jgi:hypothetical protein
MATDDWERRTFLKASAAGLAGLAAGTWPRAARASTPADRVELRFRQVHLDFHTSAEIPEVGALFDPEAFADTLVRAQVDSVTCFARCHHGYIYFDSHAHPERRHPHLTRDLLREQIAACHRRGIRVPVYSSVQWDAFTAARHPEWRVITAQGQLEGTPPFEPGFRRALCLNSPYVGFLQDHVREVLESLPVDGLFLDIVKVQDCACHHCQEAMKAAGLDAAQEDVRRAFGAEVTRRFIKDMTEFIRARSADAAIFYNSGHVDPSLRRVLPAYTHVEIESLPSGRWGYLHFPLTVRYARTLGADYLGMTGKFHTAWGDFHSYKNPAALEFECFQMLAQTAKCSIGDQLHPSGRVDPETYERIGAVYARVAEKEPWCRGATARTDIGVLSPEEFVAGGQNPAALGVTRLLQEGRHQFDVVDSAADFSRYKVMVLPDEIVMIEGLAAKLTAYLDGGGALLASYRSGLTPAQDAFALNALGVRLIGRAPFSPDFIVPGPAVDKGLPRTELVMYLEGLAVEPRAGTQVLAPVVAPYFNRTWEHFVSHRHAPSSGRPVYPGIVQRGRAVYFAHPVFTQYHQDTPLWCKKLVLNALERLLPEPLVRADAPSTAVVTLNEQADARRLVLHLLHYIPERRGDLDVIEDVIPLRDVRCDVRLDGRAVRRVTAVPEPRSIPFTARGGRVAFIVPEVQGHQMVAIDLG